MRQWDEKFVSCSYFFVTFTKALRQTVRTSSAGTASALFQLLTMTFRFSLSLAALMAGLSSIVDAHRNGVEQVKERIAFLRRLDGTPAAA